MGALASALKEHECAAFVLEPLQAEAGVVLPPLGYLAEAQALCRKHDCLLVPDEVQTGFGRLGTWFAFQQENFVPDVLVLAKALSGGAAPISVTMTSAALFDAAYGKPDRFDLQSSTLGGSALGCAAALATLAIIRDQDLCTRASRLGKRMLEDVETALEGHPFVRSVRGRGLLLGIELGPRSETLLQKLRAPLERKLCEHLLGQWLAVRLLEAGFVVQPAALLLSRAEMPTCRAGRQSSTSTTSATCPPASSVSIESREMCGRSHHSRLSCWWIPNASASSCGRAGRWAESGGNPRYTRLGRRCPSMPSAARCPSTTSFALRARRDARFHRAGPASRGRVQHRRPRARHRQGTSSAAHAYVHVMTTDPMELDRTQRARAAARTAFDWWTAASVALLFWCLPAGVVALVLVRGGYKSVTGGDFVAAAARYRFIRLWVTGAFVVAGLAWLVGLVATINEFAGLLEEFK